MDVCQTCGTQLLGRVDGDPVCRHCGPPGLGPIATTLDGRYWSAQDTPAVPARAGRPSPPASQQAQSPQHLNIPGAPLHARNSNPSSGSEGGEDNGDASDLAGLELSPDIFEQQLWDEAKQDEQAVAREGLFGDVAELLRKEQLQDLFDGLNLDDAVPDSGHRSRRDKMPGHGKEHHWRAGRTCSESSDCRKGERKAALHHWRRTWTGCSESSNHRTE